LQVGHQCPTHLSSIIPACAELTAFLVFQAASGVLQRFQPNNKQKFANFGRLKKINNLSKNKMSFSPFLIFHLKLMSKKSKMPAVSPIHP
jgi:hypothetical protein